MAMFGRIGNPHHGRVPGSANGRTFYEGKSNGYKRRAKKLAVSGNCANGAHNSCTNLGCTCTCHPSYYAKPV